MNDKIVKILESTLSLISEKGFHGTSMSQIAHTSGVAIGTIYHHFPSKDEIIFKLFFYCKYQLNSYVFKEDFADVNYKAQFYHYWKRYVDFCLEKGDIYKFFEQFFSSPYFFNNRNIINEPVCGNNKIALFIQQGITEKHIAVQNFDIAAMIFIESAVGTASRIKNEIFTNSDNNLNTILDIIWKGLN